MKTVGGKRRVLINQESHLFLPKASCVCHLNMLMSHTNVIKGNRAVFQASSLEALLFKLL